MKTDVFPEEDSVRVVWDEVMNDWGFENSEEAAERFQHGPHGYLDNGRMCSELPFHPRVGGEIELEYCYSDGPRTNLSLSINRTMSAAYFAGLHGASSRPRSNAAYAYAYDLGRDEAQLIDWQK